MMSCPKPRHVCVCVVADALLPSQPGRDGQGLHAVQPLQERLPGRAGGGGGERRLPALPAAGAGGGAARYVPLGYARLGYASCYSFQPVSLLSPQVPRTPDSRRLKAGSRFLWHPPGFLWTLVFNVPLRRRSGGNTQTSRRTPREALNPPSFSCWASDVATFLCTVTDFILFYCDT